MYTYCHHGLQKRLHSLVHRSEVSLSRKTSINDGRCPQLREGDFERIFRYAILYDDVVDMTYMNS